MDNDLDESLIEATIRRVAEAQAARDGAAPAAPADGGPEPAAVADSGALAQAAALTQEPPSTTEFEDNTIVPAAAEPQADESVIEATIRRVAAAKAARDEESTAASQVSAFDAPVAPVAPRAPDPEPLTFAHRERHGATALALQSSPEPEAWSETLERMESALAQSHAMLQRIIDRLDSLPSVRPGTSTSPPIPVDDDAWEDEAPSLPAMTFGSSPRPSILRDPPGAPTDRTTEAAGSVIDTRPLPAPLPPLQPDTRRGFDLLPRTYRITVEDKRRGVDLVPLHRALLAMDGVRDMSLLSYNNGVAIVSLETVSDIDTDALERAVSRAMSRVATVETHNERTLVVKLAED